MVERNFTPTGATDGAVPYAEAQDLVRDAEVDEQPERPQDAASGGPHEDWTFWNKQIRAGLIHERRWRNEALACEQMYFGEDEDTGENNTGTPVTSKVSEDTALIHANIDVLKPLIFSQTPQPIVRRRFRGDGKTDETDLMAAEAAQRLAEYLIEVERLDEVMEQVRDDWLIAGRGAARVHYSADIEDAEIRHPQTGQVVKIPIKTSERAYTRHAPWRRLLMAPTGTWETMPWIAFEVPMTRTKIKDRFGEDVAARMSYGNTGLVDAGRAKGDGDEYTSQNNDETETGAKPASPFDTALVWEIWSRETGEVIWWAAGYTDDVLDREPDPMELENFYPMPKPLLATTKSDSMTPRPDITYYERRAREVKLATEKLKTILDAISVSGLFPGQMSQEVKKLLSGSNEMIPVESWIRLMEKGGTNNLIQWLPLNHMITAIQALISMRDQAKSAMFEASGVSDVMRAQGDPNETATAQQIKGRYAGLRLSDRQRKMAEYIRDTLNLMLEVALEQFDTDYIADITGIELPLTEMERQQMMERQKAQQAQYQQLSQMHQQMAQAVKAGQMPGPVPPPPPPPPKERIPETSWELVHDRLRSDYTRKMTVMIETQSTVLADEQADKEARVEFLSAFSKFVSELAPMAKTGDFDFKVVKELLMFGVRGFPQSRTLEGMIQSLPDEPKPSPPPPKPPQIVVAEIKAAVDKEIQKMKLQDAEAERAHERQMKGVELVADGAAKAAEAAARPAPTPPQ